MVELITFTEAAKRHLENYLQACDDAAIVRFSVRKSGCSGFKYFAETVVQVDASDIKVCDQPLCYLAKDSVAALSGVEVDYIVTAVGSELVYKNPNAKDICGCGESFRVINHDEKR